MLERKHSIPAFPRRLLLLLALLIGAFPFHAGASGFEGSVDFTAEEQAAHQRYIGTITRTARRYLEDVYADHLAFYRRWGVSKYYGDRSVRLNTRAKRIASLQAAGAPISLIDELQPTSCIGLSLNALSAGFRAPGDENLENAFVKIRRFARANDLDGCAVIHALQKLGWRVYFWNPEPQNNERWDYEERNWASKARRTLRRQSSVAPPPAFHLTPAVAWACALEISDGQKIRSAK
jgi:hypothetical protein